MQCDGTVFKKYCDSIINNLSDGDIEEIVNAETHERRIEILFEFAKGKSTVLKDGGKSISEAEKEKLAGNSYFAKKDYAKAISSYNRGVLLCPQMQGTEKELLTILISNRSATYFEQQRYSESLKDIDYLLKTGGYPKHLMYKVWLRKAKCYEALGNIPLAAECFEITGDYLALSNLDEKSKSKRAAEIETSKKNIRQKTSTDTNTQIVQRKNTHDFIHCAVTIDEDKIQGRFARAADDIPAGEIIIEEKPFGAVLDASKSLTNCQHCFVATAQIFACSDCSHVVFCSLSCLKAATYHQTECKILPTVHTSGASVNVSLALRLITQKHLDFFTRKFLEGEKLPDDYDAVFSLCRHENATKNQLLHYTCMAVYLLRLLKTTSYFGGAENDAHTTLIGRLILHHLQLLQFNAHEISELTNVKNHSEDTETAYTSEHIGAAVYPTLALFNHSCDPSIIRYNMGKQMIVRTIKPLRAGDVIYENYGPLYTTTEKEERQKFLKDRYLFECLCKPCVEMWPSVSEMERHVLRIPCKRPRCPKVYDLNKNIECPFLTCDLCREVTSVFPYLKELMNLEAILPRAEELYSGGRYEEAMEFFLRAINIYYKYSAPPFPDLINVQQRLRSCMVHFGNKCVDYVDPSRL